MLCLLIKGPHHTSQHLLFDLNTDFIKKMKLTPMFLSFWLVVYSALTTALAWKEGLPRRAMLSGCSRRSCRYAPNSHHSCLNMALRGGGVGQYNRRVIVSPDIERPPVWAEKKRVLLMMDVFSRYLGLYLSQRAKEVYGVAVITVFSDYMKGYFSLTEPENLGELLTMSMPLPDQKDEWCRPLKDYDLVAIYCESDSGLADAERLGVLLNLTHHNGINEARRHKYLMNEVVGAAGLPVVRQRLCKSAAEARSFAVELGMASEAGASVTKRVVVKPVRGVGSDDVFLCDDIDSVEQAFVRIRGSTVFASPEEKHNVALVQEFAVGQEYCIDVVSKNGKHKVAAIWKYDKRPSNGAPFVYFGTKIYEGDAATVICDYTKQTLDALGIRWGLTHNEVILTAEGPRLVEVNCRQHNMDFAPITNSCIGYNAFDMLLASYLGGGDPVDYPPDTACERLEWDILPDLPCPRRPGAMMHLVNYAEGTLIGVNEASLIEISNMESVLDMEVYGSFLELGAEISRTKDIKTDCGWVQLVNDDSDAFQRDYDRIIELMPSLFEVDN
jgi:hypothetical protein